jgi:hypothetical protein
MQTTLTPASRAALLACVDLIVLRWSHLSYNSRDPISPIPSCTADIGDMCVTIRQILALECNAVQVPLPNSPSATSDALSVGLRPML